MPRRRLLKHHCLQVRGSDGLTCVRGEAQELKEACVVPCAKACNLAMDAYAADNERRTGYRIDPKDVARLVRSCERSCAYECSKPGKTFDFTVPFRR